MTSLPFTLQQLQRACSELPPEIAKTPLVRARTPGLHLKLETLQPTGAYKIRAAYLKLARLSPEKRRAGVALSSSGNFAAAFSWAAHRLGATAHLVMTEAVVGRKVELASRYPAHIHRCPDRYEARFEKLQELAQQGITIIDHRCDHEVFLGHGTIGEELLEAAPAFERVLLPVSTGGLAVGVAAALRLGGYRGRILGVQAAGNPTAYDSWRAGRPVSRTAIETCCDALTATSLPQQTFDWLRRLLDGMLLVQESSVWQAVGRLAATEGLVVEPGAAVGLAALLEEQCPVAGSALVLSGSNLEPETLIRALEQGFKNRRSTTKEAP